MSKTFVPDPSPWVPMTDLADLKHLGKFAEELSECGSAVSRCIIQGVDGREPSTGEPNREWLTKEIADVLCNADLVIDHFGLDRDAIEARVEFKRGYLSRWHAMGSAFHG